MAGTRRKSSTKKKLHTWKTYVTWYRKQRKQQTGKPMSYAEAIKAAKDPWAQYRAKNGLSDTAPKTSLSRKKSMKKEEVNHYTWNDFVSNWREEHPGYSFKDALTAARGDWAQYKLDNGF